MGHHRFQHRGSVSVCTCLPCCVGVRVVQRRTVCPWSGTSLSSVQSSHMLSIGHLWLGRRSALGHDTWCSFHRSVAAAVSVPVPVFVLSVGLSLGVPCVRCGHLWSCLDPWHPFLRLWQCGSCMSPTSWQSSL